METAKLTVRLPKKDLDFAKRYAQEHRITVTELIDRYLQRLQAGQVTAIHPEVERISGLVPSEIDAEVLYHEHLMSKHR
jgi:energy-converting hydrogenase A subunit M